MQQLNTPHDPGATGPALHGPEPKPTTPTAPGSYLVNLTANELGDPTLRALTGRNLRYWLLHHLNTHPDTSHKVADLVTAITEDGFTLNGRASKTVSDALATETARGRITRTGWGRYQITRPLAPTTAWRIRKQLTKLHRHIQWIIADAKRTVEQRFRQPGITAGLLHHGTTRKLQAHIYIFFNRTKVANPTERHEKQRHNPRTTPSQTPHF